ncbi:MAG: DNA adenine methylase, partial [Thermoprotei archaeon]
MRFPGSKWYLAKWIISHFPPHRVFVDVFGGSGAIILRKP